MSLRPKFRRIQRFFFIGCTNDRIDVNLDIIIGVDIGFFKRYTKKKNYYGGKCIHNHLPRFANSYVCYCLGYFDVNIEFWSIKVIESLKPNKSCIEFYGFCGYALIFFSNKNLYILFTWSQTVNYRMIIISSIIIIIGVVKKKN